jgi:hypothetical protein
MKVRGEWRYHCTALVGGKLPAALPDRVTAGERAHICPLDTNLVGPQSRSGRYAENIFHFLGSNTGLPAHSLSLYRAACKGHYFAIQSLMCQEMGGTR